MYNMEQGHNEFTIRPGEFELFGSTQLEIQYAIGHTSLKEKDIWTGAIRLRVVWVWIITSYMQCMKSSRGQVKNMTPERT